MARVALARTVSRCSPVLTAVAACTLELSACQREQPASAPVRVAAASDLAAAFAELGRSFERETGQSVTFTFGSSGLLARQLAARAPYDLFAAASPRFVDQAVAAGACEGSQRARFGTGRVALYARGAGVELAELRSERYRRIAIANPEHAPYGRAAREVLERAGLFTELEPRIVYADNVRAALELATSGHVDAALVAHALVVEREGPYTLLSSALHDPIEQELVPCSFGTNAQGGRGFAAYVASPYGRAVMQRYGFAAPVTAERK